MPKHEWMVYDEYSSYLEKIICPTEEWAKEIRTNKLYSTLSGRWKIAKVKVQILKNGKRIRRIPSVFKLLEPFEEGNLL